jgi:hypothetical protein
MNRRHFTYNKDKVIKAINAQYSGRYNVDANKELEWFVDCMEEALEKVHSAHVPLEPYRRPLSPDYIKERLASFGPIDVSAGP